MPDTLSSQEPFAGCGHCQYCYTGTQRMEEHMAAKTKRSIFHREESKPEHTFRKASRVDEPTRQDVPYRDKNGRLVLPPGPSNIIVRTPYPFPVRKGEGSK